MTCMGPTDCCKKRNRGSEEQLVSSAEGGSWPFREDAERRMARTEEIKEFWATMRNSKTRDDGTRLNQYLEQLVSDYEVHDTFPSEAKFGKIVFCLPNWKAAGSDKVYNFFIKKWIFLHPNL
ncbi:unnamed protein product [Thelazia callipaeda]|uniref:Ovule protein n=1 Tax=Thelazia callipaeda TaxID=103827 RepID=A0A0N5CY47_THECL|nr:unnamed protein product [Thelazia callipaeda]